VVGLFYDISSAAVIRVMPDHVDSTVTAGRG